MASDVIIRMSERRERAMKISERSKMIAHDSKTAIPPMTIRAPRRTIPILLGIGSYLLLQECGI